MVLNNFISSGGAPVGDGPDAAKGSPLAVQHEAQKSVPGAAPASSQGQAQLNRSSSVGANQRAGGGWILHILSCLQHFTSQTGQGRL